PRRARPRRPGVGHHPAAVPGARRCPVTRPLRWYWSTCGLCGGQARSGLPCGTCGWEYGAIDPAGMGLRVAVTVDGSRFPGALDEYSVAVGAALAAGLLTADRAGGIRVTEAGIARLEQDE